MDSFLFFEILPDGSTALSPPAILRLESLLCAARTQDKRVSIELICGENLSIQLRLQVHPTMSWGSLSTSWRRHLLSQLPGLSGRLGAGSGEDVTAIQSTSEFGKGE